MGRRRRFRPGPDLDLAGTGDLVTPPAHAEWWQRKLPHAELVLREGRGHLGAFEAHREEMLGVLRDAG